MTLSKDKVTDFFLFCGQFLQGILQNIESHTIEEGGKPRREP